MIGTIVGEYFISGPMIGIGKVIRNELKGGRLTSGWSHIVIATLLGAALYILVLFFEKYAVRTVNALRSIGRKRA
jgi:ABC-type nitrate/sulfonate/bicarbonate transport system permease component